MAFLPRACGFLIPRDESAVAGRQKRARRQRRLRFPHPARTALPGARATPPAVPESNALVADRFWIAAVSRPRDGKRGSGTHPTSAHTASPCRWEFRQRTWPPWEDMAAGWGGRFLETPLLALLRVPRPPECGAPHLV